MPQHAKRVKIRRKDLRQPDEFETVTGQLVDWADNHRPALLAGAIAVALIAIGFLGVNRWRASENAAAASDFRAAHALFDAGKYDEATTAFNALIVDYSRTPAGDLARLYRAHTIARGGEAADAVTAYTEYLASSPASPYLQQEALTGLGYAKEAADDKAGALEAYAQAGAMDGPFQQDAMLAEARLREAKGETARAREIYTKLLETLPEGDLRALVISKLPPGTATAPAPELKGPKIPVPMPQVQVQ
jgi:tetratricopeptide (TPR) repeat protein